MSELQLAENIKTLRQKKGLSQWQVSRILKFKGNMCGVWERRIAMPSNQCVINLSQLFGTTINDLVRKDLSKVFTINSQN